MFRPPLDTGCGARFEEHELAFAPGDCIGWEVPPESNARITFSGRSAGLAGLYVIAQHHADLVQGFGALPGDEHRVYAARALTIQRGTVHAKPRNPRHFDGIKNVFQTLY